MPPPSQRAQLSPEDTMRRVPSPVRPRSTVTQGNRRQLPGGATIPEALEAEKRIVWPVVLFLVSLVIPWVISIGPLRLSVYRIVLVVFLMPCLLRLAKGQAGRVRLPDIAMFLYCLWGMVCLTVAHGPAAALQSGGILFVETAGAYLLGRCYVRNADDFYHMVSVLFKVVVFLLPFGIIEMLTGTKPLLKLFGVIMPTIDITMMDRRWGLYRVQGPFEHPLLFGVCCGSILALTHLVLGYGQSFVQRWFKTAVVVGTAFLALSSGPLTALIAQILLLSWNRVLVFVPARWKILWALIILMNIVVYLYSGQSIARFFISHAPLFDAWSAYYRILIWENGVATVLNHPIFGIGYHEYERPSWMAKSVDMFWLNHAIMFGLPGAFLVAVTFISTVGLVGAQSSPDTKLNEYKTAYLIAMAAFFVVGWTVHFWNGTYSLFFFLLASGLWLAEPSRLQESPAGVNSAPVRQPGNAIVNRSGGRDTLAKRPPRVSQRRTRGG